jgi:uridine kinase
MALPHPTRVAVDGVDGAGKTVLADELAQALRARGRTCIRASIDGFHHPRADRHRRGRSSSNGYYLDSFDLRAVRSVLLEPLGPGGSLRYRRAVFDHRADREVAAFDRVAPPDAILLFDGVFLLRPELIDCWDLTLFVDVEIETGARRALARDGRTRSAEHLYRDRYMPAQRRYLETVRPRERAHAVLVNEDLREPRLVLGLG